MKKPGFHFFYVLFFWLFMSAPIMAEDDNVEWEYLKKRYFSDVELIDEHEVFKLKAPFRAEDAAFTPISIVSSQSPSMNSSVKSLYLFVDKNPDPLAGIYHFHQQLSVVDISTRLRIDRYSHIRAVMITRDDQYYLRSAFIKASGGCSAPPPQDNTLSVQQMGKMRIKLQKRDDVDYMTLQIRHPNHSGMQRDFVSQGFIPPHYVKHIAMTNGNSKPLLELETGISMSSDPTIRLRVSNENIQNLKVKVTDSKSQKWERDFSSVFDDSH